MHNPSDTSATALGALLCFVWGAFLLGWLVQKSRIVAETVLWFRKASGPIRILVVIVFLSIVAYGGSKGNGNSQQNHLRPPLLQTVVELPPTPSVTAVSVCTNGVVFRAETTNAVELAAFRRIGGTELGEWLDAEAPFFAIGTNPVSRCYVAASGSVSFESMRRPPVGAPLPDGTGLPVLCPLRAPLGMAPEANWTIAGAQSRFWHETLPGGGRVLTWEDALVDRLPGRRVSLQVELRPSGDSVFRYDFHDALDPPATNFTIGAQMGTNGVNALSILGTNVLAATVWNVEGEPVTNGVSIADLLCTNGVFRTPASFEIRWRNTTGLDPNADTDEDGLTDWSETFLWGTDPNVADTDGDGIADNVELMMGMNPFDADEDADGIPDGMSESDWLANPLWAANATNGVNVVISLNEAIPAGSSATLVLGDLSIPLRSPASWSLCLEPGQMYDFRLYSQDNAPVDISLTPPSSTSVRLMAPLHAPTPSDGSEQNPLWQSPKDALDGPTRNTSGQLAVPELSLEWIDPGDGSHATGTAGVCLHSESGSAMFRAVIRPSGMGITEQDLVCEGMEGSGTTFGLFVSAEPGSIASGSVSFAREDLRYGNVTAHASAHRSWPMLNGVHCAICDVAGEHINDVSLSIRSPLTLKHDSQTVVSFHCEQPRQGPASNPQILIRRKGTTDWYPLAQSFRYDWTARVAGFFELKGVATIDGMTVETTPVEVEVQYPCYDEVFSDDSVQEICANLWSETKQLCTETQRQEVGCWIDLDTSTGEYIREQYRYGDVCDNDHAASVKLQMKYDDVDVSPISMGYRYPVATVHAHTPTTHRSVGRVVGPTGKDVTRAQFPLAAPSAVIDYLPAPDSDFPNAANRIPAHHLLDASAKLWKIDLPARRLTPGVRQQ